MTKTNETMSLPCDLTLCGHTYCGNIERHTYHRPAQARYPIVDSHGESITTLTFNPHQHVALGPNECVIKDYSENEGVLAQLIALGIVRDTGRRVPSGWIEGPVVEITAASLLEGR